jgi:hypothetical protein
VIRALTATVLVILLGGAAVPAQSAQSEAAAAAVKEYSELGVRAAFPVPTELDVVPIPGSIQGRNARSLFGKGTGEAYLILRLDAKDLAQQPRAEMLDEVGRGIASGASGGGQATVESLGDTRLGGEPARDFRIAITGQPVSGRVRVALHGDYLFAACAFATGDDTDKMVLAFLDSIAFTPSPTTAVRGWRPPG